MKKFKPGDNVIFIDCEDVGDGISLGWAREACIKGQIYTITEADRWGIRVLGINLWLNPKQFKLQQKEFVLPEKWCVKNTKSNIEVLEDWRGQGKGSLGSISGDVCGYLCSNKIWVLNIPEDYTRITFAQFKKYVLKKNTEVKQIIEPIKKSVMKKTAQTFKITSRSEALLEAMWKELLAIGYNGEHCQEIFTVITHNKSTSTIKSKEDFIDLWDDAEYLGKDDADKTFYLPEQYNEAIEFAKEQLLDKYWVNNPEFKVGDVVVVEKWYYSSAIKLPQTAEITEINSRKGDTEPYKINAYHRTISGWWFREGEFRLATPEEVQTYENNLLLKEANERFPKDTRVCCNIGSFSNFNFTRGGELMVYKPGNIAASGEPWVCFEGKWAEVIPENIIIKGYSCEFDGDTVSFGCQSFDKHVVTDLVRLLDLEVISSEYEDEIRLLNRMILK